MGCGDSKDAQQVEQGIAAYFGKAVVVKSVHGKYLRAAEGDSSAVNQAAEMGEWEQWTVEDAGEGKIFLKSFHGTYLRAADKAEEEGAVAGCTVAAAAGDWGKFEAIAEGESFWRLKTAHGTFLRAADGDDFAVNQQAEADVGEWENWTVMELVKKDEAAAPAAAAAPVEDTSVNRLVGKPITVKSVAHGSFLKAFPAAEENKVAQAEAAGDWEVFTLVAVEGQEATFVIKSEAHALNLRASDAAAEGDERPKVNTSDAAEAWEQWVMEVVEGDTVRFKSTHGTYLRADAGGQDAIVDLSTEAGDWESWTLALQEE